MLMLFKLYVLAGLIMALFNIGINILSGDLQEALNGFRKCTSSDLIYDICSCMAILIGVAIAIITWPIIIIKSLIH